MIGELASIGCAFTWALTSILLRSQSERLDALWLNALRCITGSLMALVVALVFRSPEAFANLEVVTLLLLFTSVFIGLGIGDTLYLRSMALLGVARAMPLSGVYPLFTMLIALTLLGEKLTWLNILGIFIIVASVYFLAFPGKVLDSTEMSVTASGSAAGVLMGLGASLFWAASTAIIKLALEDIDFMAANALRLPMASAVLLSWAYLTSGSTPLRKAGPRCLSVVALAGFFGTGLGSTLFLIGVQLAGAAKAAPLSSLSPLFAAPLSAIFLGEQINLRIAVGTILSITGVWLVL